MQSNILKFFLLGFLTTILSIASFSSVYAQTDEQKTLAQTTIQPYLELFTPESGLSTPSGGYLMRDATNNNVTGFKLNIRLHFSSQYQSDPIQGWDKTKEDTTNLLTAVQEEDVFVIKLCQKGTDTVCHLQTIPYDDNSFQGSQNNYIISRKDQNSEWQALQTISNFPLLGEIPAGQYKGTSGVRYLYKKESSNTWETSRNATAAVLNAPNTDINYEATLWYCSYIPTYSSISSAIETLPGFNTTFTKFDDLCGGNTFFRIGSPLTLTAPKKTDTGIINENENTATTTKEDSTSNLPACALGIVGETHFVGCIARAIYYGLYWPINWIAGLFGSMFDFFIGYSVSDASYRYEFAVTGWKIVRDIANIFFIIILIYTGFAAVFSFGGKGGSTMKKVVPALIINALIINFSLFATRTVIDVSNIAARIFYSQMIVCKGTCDYSSGSSIPDNIKRGWGGYWPLSEKIVASFEPQRLLTPSVLESKQAVTTIDDPFGNQTQVGRLTAKGFTKDSDEYAGYYALVSLLSAIIMAAIAAMFFKVMFMFLGRVVGLYVAMIFSPFAFLTRGGGGGFIDMKSTGWDWGTWAKNLITYASLAPIFTFFLYIIYSFLQTDFVKQIGLENRGEDLFSKLISIAIPMLIIYQLINYGGKLAAKYAGEFGMMAQNMLGKLTGVVGGAALGVAAGGVALAGRTAVGQLGKAASKSGLTSWAANSNTRIGRGVNSALNKLQTSSFDIRNSSGMTNLLNRGLGQVTGGGIKLDTDFAKGTFIGKDMTAGGVVGYKKRREEVREKAVEAKYDEKNYSHLSKDEVKELWEKRRERKINELRDNTISAEGVVDKYISQQINAHLMANNVDYQRALSANTNLANGNKTIEETIKKEQDKLKDGTLTDTERAAANQTISQAQEQLKERNNKIAENNNVVKTLENNQHNDQTYMAALKGTDAFKQKEREVASTATVNATKAVDKEYGNIEDAKGFSQMMAYDHTKKMQQNSFWMKNGKGRFGQADNLTTAGAVSTIATGIFGAATTMALDAFNNEMKAVEAARSNQIKKYQKNKKGFSKKKKKEDYVEEMESNQTTINAKIKELSNYQSKTEGEIGNLSIKEQKEAINDIVRQETNNYEDAIVDYKVAEEAYLEAVKAGKTPNEVQTLKTNMQRVRDEKQRAKDVIDKFKNILSAQEKLQEKIEKTEKEEAAKDSKK